MGGDGGLDWSDGWEVDRAKIYCEERDKCPGKLYNWHVTNREKSPITELWNTEGGRE